MHSHRCICGRRWAHDDSVLTFNELIEEHYCECGREVLDVEYLCYDYTTGDTLDLFPQSLLVRQCARSDSPPHPRVSAMRSLVDPSRAQAHDGRQK